MVPVKMLQDAGAEVIIVGVMGARPMLGFADVGITTYFADRSSMKTAMDAVLGLTPPSYLSCRRIRSVRDRAIAITE